MKRNTSYVKKFIPNIITILALCCGLSSIRFSVLNEWNIAILLIIFAAIFDFFDGWFATKLKSGSNFGAGLDSLSDIISFGAAPSFLIYYWSLFHLDSLGWGATLFFVVCSALRLARFTADIYLAPKKIDSKIYFVGVPSPAAAGLSLLPIFCYLEFGYDIMLNPFVNLINITLIGILMVSKIPTISIKSLTFNKKYTPLIVLFIVVFSIGLLSNIWLTLLVVAIIYVLSIFYTVFSNIKSKY